MLSRDPGAKHILGVCKLMVHSPDPRGVLALCEEFLLPSMSQFLDRH